MRPWKSCSPNSCDEADDEGSAALEFLTVGLILLIPLAYLIVTLGAIQQQTLAVESTARYIARVIGRAPDAATAEERSEAILANAAEEYGLDEDSIEVSIACTPAEGECPAAGATVMVTVSVHAGLPFLPPLLGADRPPGIPLEATAVQKISRLWGASG